MYMKINYVNPEHVHTLIDLPTNKTIEEVVQLFKGGSSHWINEEKLLRGFRLGTRLWRVFGFALRSWASWCVYCRTGGTSRQEKLLTGVRVIREEVRVGVA